MGRLGSVSSGGRGTDLVAENSGLLIFSFLKRFFISCLTDSSVSPGIVLRSISISQELGTTLGCDPPQIVPTLIVGDPNNGCFLSESNLGYSLIRVSRIGDMPLIAFLPYCGVDPCAAFPFVKA